MSSKIDKWNINNNYVFKPVDSLSVLNKKTSNVINAWNTEDGLVSPTNKIWLFYKLGSTGRTTDIPFFEIPALLSGSFNKIVFPSLHPESFLTQSVDSYLYYLDVYESKQVPFELDPLVFNTGIYVFSLFADTSRLIFDDTGSSTGYSSIALLPESPAFTLAWGSVTHSAGAISSSRLPNTSNTSPSTAVYSTYKSILNITSSLYPLYTQSLEHFYVIDIAKEKLKDGVSPGTVEIPFMVSASNISFTSSNIYNNNILFVTDDSENILRNGLVGSYSYLVSGTLDNKNTTDIYGHIYYDMGILVLDSAKLNNKLNLNLNLNTYPTDIAPFLSPKYENELNTVKLFNSIQACSYKNENINTDLYISSESVFTPYYFKCSTIETSIENPVFIYIRPNEFNYSINPSWQQNELLGSSIITSSTIPVSCKSFTDFGYGCNELLPLQQKYVYWYYSSGSNPAITYAAYFIKNQNGECSCEFLGNYINYKRNNQLPHLKYKSGIIQNNFVKNPVTYISSIGLYNDAYELLAVAKLSKPIKNTINTSYVIKVNIKI